MVVLLERNVLKMEILPAIPRSKPEIESGGYEHDVEHLCLTHVRQGKFRSHLTFLLRHWSQENDTRFLLRSFVSRSDSAEEDDISFQDNASTID